MTQSLFMLQQFMDLTLYKTLLLFHVIPAQQQGILLVLHISVKTTHLGDSH